MLLMTGPRVTHEVLNQVPPLAGHDVAQDPALLEALDREGAGAVLGELHELGALAGAEQTQEQARLANEYVPRLRTAAETATGWTTHRRPALLCLPMDAANVMERAITHCALHINLPSGTQTMSPNHMGR